MLGSMAFGVPVGWLAVSIPGAAGWSWKAIGLSLALSLAAAALVPGLGLPGRASGVLFGMAAGGIAYGIARGVTRTRDGQSVEGWGASR